MNGHATRPAKRNSRPVPAATGAQAEDAGAAEAGRAEPEWSLDLAAVGATASADAPSAADRPWVAGAPGSVGFCDEGIVTPTRGASFIESLNDASSFAGEELRLLAVKVQDIRRERGVTCLALTSTLPGEGKSTVAVGLAGALAREPGRRVLLIEADVRRPSLTPTLGLPPAAGLGEWLNGGLDYVPVRLIEPGGFFLLVAGKTDLERPELLGSQRMDALLRAARGLFDFVLLDTMPVLPVADAVLMQDLVDGFLLVVRSRQTRRDAIQDALARLRADRLLGVVLNDHEEQRDSYRARAYKHYGMTYGARSSPRRSGGFSDR
jgi:capsular exopolysaccharide synthesis family protein